VAGAWQRVQNACSFGSSSARLTWNVASVNAVRWNDARHSLAISAWQLAHAALAWPTDADADADADAALGGAVTRAPHAGASAAVAASTVAASRARTLTSRRPRRW